MKVFITGKAGVGKTSVLAELQKQGFVVIDLDATGLCKWKNKATGLFTEYGKEGRDSEWLAQHGWYCDIPKLKILLSCIREDKYVFVAGIAENVEMIVQEFDKVFLLTIDDESIKQRLTSRTNNHFGRKEDEQRYIIDHNHKLLEKLKDYNSIDANQSTDVIARTILKDLNLNYSI